jgi:PAS domain-containing protein
MGATSRECRDVSEAPANDRSCVDSDARPERRLDLARRLRVPHSFTDLVGPIWVVDPEGVIRFTNPAAIASLGYDGADELCGRDSHDRPRVESLHAHWAARQLSLPESAGNRPYLRTYPSQAHRREPACVQGFWAG